MSSNDDIKKYLSLFSDDEGLSQNYAALILTLILSLIIAACIFTHRTELSNGSVKTDFSQA